MRRHQLSVQSAFLVLPLLVGFTATADGQGMMPGRTPVMGGMPAGPRNTFMGGMQPQLGNAFTNSGASTLVNPYSSGRYGQSSGGNPYGAYMGSGMGYGGYQGNGTNYSNGSAQTYPSGAGTADPNSADSQQNSAQIAGSLLTASGVPIEGGRLNWPAGLRALAAPGCDELRRQSEALFQQAALQAADGPVNPEVARDLRHTVGELRRLLLKDKDERFALPWTVYEECERFLARLDRAERNLRAGSRGASGRAQLQTASSLPASKSVSKSVMTVGLYDDFFAPNALLVPVGTTVQWKNQGPNDHSVVADDGSWGSNALHRNQTYEYTFDRPGIYDYHCAEHASEMRGQIVVK
jgi:plastocyanin